MRALVADADDVRRAALREELERHGHEVVEASSTREVLVDDRAELVALGEHPEDDVLEVVRGLRSARAGDDVVVVVLGDAERLDVVAALEAGASDVWGVPRGGAGVPQDARIRLSLAEHYARLQAEVVRVGGEFTLLRRALDLTGTGFVLTDPRLEDNPIVYANRSFYEMTGYSREEVLGRNCRFLQGEATDGKAVDELRKAIGAARPASVELLNHRRDGTVFHNEVHISPVRDERGKVVRFVGVQVDVSAYRDVEVAGRRSAFLAEAGPLMDATLDVRRTLDAIVRVSVPRLGEACLVSVAGTEDVERLAAAAEDSRLRRIIDGLPSRYVLEGDDPVAVAIASGETAILNGDAAARALGPEAVRLERLRPWSAMVVPLRARGRALGALTLVRLEDHDFARSDIPLAEELAHRAALAIDNARLYSAQRGVADALQSSLLPRRLPSVDGVELAARYRPYGEGMDIGGDFYDAFAGRDGTTALAVGDVTGKGAAAAAITGLARHTLRAAAAYERTPSGVLGALNRALLDERESRGRYCTVALAQLERVNGHWRATVSRAGHPVPFVVRADGRVEEAGVPGTLLGYVEDPRLEDHEVLLGPGDALVLYTDGVSEASAAHRASGEAWVAERLREAAGGTAEALAARLERAAVEAQDGRPRDDVAVAVARVTA